MTFFASRLLPVWPSCSLALLLTDCAALAGTSLLVGTTYLLYGAPIDVDLHLQLMLFLLVAPLYNFNAGLYNSPPPPPHEELRGLTLSTTLAFLGIIVFLFVTRGTTLPSRLITLVAWMLCLCTVPLARALLRSHYAHRSWWSRPTLLIGPGAQARELAAHIRRTPRLGLRPEGILSTDEVRGAAELSPSGASTAWSPWSLRGPDEAAATAEPDGDAACPGSEVVDDFVRTHSSPSALVLLTSEAMTGPHPALVRQVIRKVPGVIFIPIESVTEDLPFRVRPVQLGLHFGLKLHQNLLDPRRLALKRGLDLLLCCTGGLLVLPFLLFIALAIMVESPGTPFFRQQRIGRWGKPLTILKFRTMVPDAEAQLQRCLAKDPELRAEWEADQKLRCDPRITRVGQLLRKTSLDELPQIWNVLLGDMSLVGPRPIVESEIAKYGQAFDAYVEVRPGITGLWQVSGRNDLSYTQRILLDRYYISNWSIWLDLAILLRTVPVVFGRKGAY